jgi:dTDP-4-dehydrorhamnose 3,5-epimerase
LYDLFGGSYWEASVSLEVKRLQIMDACLVELQSHEDARGAFIEVWRQAWIGGSKPPQQANISISKSGVLRGLHYHLHQSDYWVLVKGRALVGLYDFRKSSVTSGDSQLIELSADKPQGLYIPPGILHGYYALEDCILLYLVDRVYDGTDEHGVAWNDPDLGLTWPVTEPVLSPRDRENPKLAEVPADKRPA